MPAAIFENLVIKAIAKINANTCAAFDGECKTLLLAASAIITVNKYRTTITPIVTA